MRNVVSCVVFIHFAAEKFLSNHFAKPCFVTNSRRSVMGMTSYSSRQFCLDLNRCDWGMQPRLSSSSVTQRLCRKVDTPAAHLQTAVGVKRRVFFFNVSLRVVKCLAKRAPGNENDRCVSVG